MKSVGQFCVPSGTGAYRVASTLTTNLHPRRYWMVGFRLLGLEGPQTPVPPQVEGSRRVRGARLQSFPSSRNARSAPGRLLPHPGSLSPRSHTRGRVERTTFSNLGGNPRDRNGRDRPSPSTPDKVLPPLHASREIHRRSVRTNLNSFSVIVCPRARDHVCPPTNTFVGVRDQTTFSLD